MQRLEARVVDPQRDLRLVVAGQVDRMDRPDRDAADLDEVALDELAGALDERPHLVARAAAAQQHEGDHDQCDPEQQPNPYPGALVPQRSPPTENGPIGGAKTTHA